MQAWGQRVSSDAVNVDNKVLVAVSVGWDVTLSMGGRMLQWRRNGKEIGSGGCSGKLRREGR